MALGGICASFPVCALAWALFALNSYAKTVTLTNGKVELRHVSPAEVATANEEALAAGAAETSALNLGFGAAARLSSALRDAAVQDPVWGQAPSRRMFLLSYNDDAHAKRIIQSLRARQAHIISYISDQNFLVAARPDEALQIAFEHEAELAELDPRLKLSSEWRPLTVSAGSTSDSGNNDTADYPLPTDSELDLAMLLNTLTVFGPDQSSDPNSNSNLPRYGVLAELQPGITVDALGEVEREWPDLLAAAVAAPGGGRHGENSRRCQPIVVAPTASTTAVGSVVRLSIYLCMKDLAAGLGWLAERPEVMWLSPVRKARGDNILSSFLLQTGDLPQQYVSSTMRDNPSEMYMPYWNANLQGQDEIVGVGDSGIDMESCYFSDPLYAGNYTAMLKNEASLPRRQGLPYAELKGHRKVVQYAIMKTNSGSGDGLDRNGHGTSTSGCLAGAVLVGDGMKIETSVDQATGAAPKARISFIDLSNDTRDVMHLPDDLYSGYFEVHRSVGVHIHSNSWGVPAMKDATYQSTSEALDRFLWSNPESIAIFSASNDGAKVVGRASVSEPALAKNAVAVGASANLVGTKFYMYRLRMQWRNGKVDEMMLYPNENRKLPLLSDLIPNNGQLRMVMADPLAACKSLHRLRQKARGGVVMVEVPKQCDTYTQVQQVMRAGAVAMIILRSDFNDESPAPDPISPNLELFNTSAVSWLGPEWGEFLKSLSRNTSLLGLFISKSEGVYDSKVVLHFSGAGPLKSGRIKPDITAPGLAIMTASKLPSAATASTPDVVSASCPTAQRNGTSYSTPLIAGNVAIMRQYLRSGYYPTGAAGDPTSAPFSPSGILLKALIVAGAVSLEGGVAMLKGGPMGPPPDGYQGWGRMSLSGALPLRGVTDPLFRLQLVDWGSFSAMGQSATLSGLTATGTGPITIVMVFYDYPSSRWSGDKAINNLDLVVELDPGGKRVLGNQPEDATKPRADGVNTVERVLLAAPAAGTAIRIIVNATSLNSTVFAPAETQRWAVAVVGHFVGMLDSPLNPEWAKRHGLVPQAPGEPPQEPEMSPPSPPDPPPPLPRPPKKPGKRNPPPPPPPPPSVPAFVP